MSKITKKQLQRKIERQETRIDRLVGMLAKKGFYDKFKKLDQSIFNDAPPHLRWAAIEEDGSVYLFAKKPFIDLCKWAAGTDEVEVYIGTEYDASDWQNSLIERESKELTGSALAKDYFKRGCCPRVCFVGEDDDECLSDLMVAMVIGYVEGKGFETSYHDFFPCAAMVNSYGDELEASEVGS